MGAGERKVTLYQATAPLGWREGEGPSEKKALPFPRNESFRLLGLKLGDTWASREHSAGARKELTVGLAVSGKVSNEKWGLGNRILTTTARALSGSPMNDGLTATGSAATESDLQQLNAQVPSPTARRVAGAGPSIRREVHFTSADLRTTRNHSLLKVANLIDRSPQADDTQIQQHAERYLQGKGSWGGMWRGGSFLRQRSKAAIGNANPAE